MSDRPSPSVVERVMNDQATDEVERLFTAAIAVIDRLRDGFPWPLTERADGFRYWSSTSTMRYVWEPLTDAERAVVEWMEARRSSHSHAVLPTSTANPTSSDSAARDAWHTDPEAFVGGEVVPYDNEANKRAIQQAADAASAEQFDE